MSREERVRLSKMLALMLRHQPEKFGLALDAEGFTPLAAVLAALRRERRWAGVTEADVRDVVASSDKQRYEIDGERIRARYGHSVEGKVEHEPVEPPEVLYHGTSPEAVARIRAEGLRSMRRQYVHLSTSVEQARAVGARHSRTPVILTVRAREAWTAGVRFYLPEARLYMADAVPPKFIIAEA
jgi:putative RNA 2'-phosphotransferase